MSSAEICDYNFLDGKSFHIIAAMKYLISWLNVPPESQNFANPWPPYNGGPSKIEVPQVLGYLNLTGTSAVRAQDLTWIQHIHTGKGQ